MDIARDLRDNAIYQAETFKQLPAAEMLMRLGTLVCPECEAPAFYRGPTRNGRSACFGARPHAPQCTLAAIDVNEFSDDAQDTNEASILNSQRIVVDLSSQQPLTGLHLPWARQQRSNSPFVTHRRLSTLLRLLASEPLLRHSRQTLELPDVGTFVVGDFFVPFNAAAPIHENRFHGFWGMLTSAKRAHNDTVWLNAGGINNISVCIPGHSILPLMAHFQIQALEDLAGAMVLVLGTLSCAPNGKKYIMLQSVAHIALDLTVG